MPPPRVVVTGVGLVSPLGAGAAASWKRLLAGGSGVVRLPKLAGLPVDIGGAVPRGAFAVNDITCSKMGFARIRNQRAGVMHQEFKKVQPHPAAEQAGKLQKIEA